MSFPAPENHIAEVEARIPTVQQATLELMMPVWTPGYYRVEDYASQVSQLTARSPDGSTLEVTQPSTNRWRINGVNGSHVTVNYRLRCEGRSVTRNWVGTNLVVLNGAAAFPALVESNRRPYAVRMELPPGWERAVTALPAARGGRSNHFWAADYDALVDGPIVAGTLSVHEFAVNGSRHVLVDAGDVNSQWNGQHAAQSLERMVRAHQQFWGELPFQRYVFLNVFRQGGGGLEHRDSTLLTESPSATSPTRSWLAFVSHEYFHAMNVKRLRPVEFNTFDYELPARTASLWVSEGLTTYYGELLIVRAGLSSPEEFLTWLSLQIARLQSQPGRLAQTLEQASLDVWNTPTSGLARNAPTNTVSYYVKGPVVGFLLDAKIQQATTGRRSLDDLMRLAYQRYSGEHGFTPEQFRKTAEEIAGTDLQDWFRRALASTEELDYAEALEWFGLQFRGEESSGDRWKLEVRAEASPAQKARWRKLTGVKEDRE